MLLVILSTLNFIINIMWFIIIVSAIFSWLYAFNVINTRNQFVNQVGGALYRLTEPLYRPIRRFMPNLGGIDLSPLVVLVILFFLQQVIAYIARTYG
ncbi:YggT family protein [Rhizobium sp. LjRoot254]|uniref:YggT family protein n=1 Tax=Rhizobium sp. LjRoot254 TaxID=3342297 RepID=UPI003ECCB86E